MRRLTTLDLLMGDEINQLTRELECARHARNSATGKGIKRDKCVQVFFRGAGVGRSVKKAGESMCNEGDERKNP